MTTDSVGARGNVRKTPNEAPANAAEPPAIIRTQAAIADAPMSVLLATYNAMSEGPPCSRFSSRAVAERRVAQALLAAEDAAGHLGVARNARPVALTAAERAAKSQPSQPPIPPTIDAPAAAVSVAANGAVTLTPARPPKEKPKARSQARLLQVRFTGAGTSKPRPGSTRHAVLAFIAAVEGGVATIDALDAHFKESTRGYVQKLIEMKHLEAA